MIPSYGMGVAVPCIQSLTVIVYHPHWLSSWFWHIEEDGTSNVKLLLLMV